MLTHHYNGEYWWTNHRSWLVRLLRWLAWFGGWERQGKLRPIQRRLRGRRNRWTLVSPAPLSLLGHRFTYYGWGCQLRWGDQWMVWSWREKEWYISPDGTPQHATTWLRGTPSSILAEARP